MQIVHGTTLPSKKTERGTYIWTMVRVQSHSFTNRNHTAGPATGHGSQPPCLLACRVPSDAGKRLLVSDALLDHAVNLSRMPETLLQAATPLHSVCHCSNIQQLLFPSLRAGTEAGGCTPSTCGLLHRFGRPFMVGCHACAVACRAASQKYCAGT